MLTTIVLVIFLGTSAKLLSKAASHRVSTYALIFLTMLGGSIVSSSMLAIFTPQSFVIPSNLFLPLLCVIAVWGIATVYNYIGIRETSVSMRESLIQTRMLFIPFIPFIAVLFLHEHFSLLDGFGTLLVFIGVLIASYKRSSGFRHADTQGAGYVIFASFLVAIASSLDKYFVSHMDAIYYSCFINMGGLFFTSFFMNRERAKELVAFIRNRHSALITIAGVLLGNFFFIGQLWLYKHLDLHVAYPLIQLGSALALILAIIFFHERERIAMKIGGFGIAALGAIILRLAA